MRSMLIGAGITMKAVMLLAILSIVLLSFNKILTQKLLYPLARQFAKAKMNYETRNMNILVTEHFIIKYSDSDKGIISMVSEAAEAAYVPVTAAFEYNTREKALVVVYPDRKELRRAFGWSGNQSAMGVYWGGAIQILSPRDWLKAGETAADFIKSGPMAHEFTHLVFDYMTNGNYPRWFTEGLAQYVEYRLNKYEWITADNHMTNKLYTMKELEDSFDSLQNEALAYREAFAAVRYIAEIYGEDKLRDIVNSLQAGKNIRKAIPEVLDMDYEAYYTAWNNWAQENMQ